MTCMATCEQKQNFVKKRIFRYLDITTEKPESDSEDDERNVKQHKRKEEIEFLVHVDPDELEGMEVVWQMYEQTSPNQY